jgi:N-terminal domain of reverse transcriptase
MSAVEIHAGAAPDQIPDWHSINWRKVWRAVRRLQARIVKAVAQSRWNKVKPRENPDHACGARLRLLGTERATLSLRQGLDQAVSPQRQDILDQDPGNDQELGQPDGGRNDPAFESTYQRLDHVPPLCREHLEQTVFAKCRNTAKRIRMQW